LTHGRVDALAVAAGDKRLAVLFLAYTGVRFGEMAGLRVRNLNLLRRRAHITEAVSEVGGRLIFDTPKTHLNRSVPIPRFLVDELAVHVAGKGPDEHVSRRRGGPCYATGTGGAPARTSRWCSRCSATPRPR